MKRSFIYIFLIVSILGMAVYFFTPLGLKARGYVGRLLSRNAVALKTDRQLSDKAYAWELTDSEGDGYQFAKERGKVVFLNFWATWCAPCLKELPDIQNLYYDYGDEVGFLLVTQEETAMVRAFMDKKDYTLPVFFTDRTDIPEELASKSLPTTYIIGKSGKIVRAETGEADWDSEVIRKLLDSLLRE